MTSIGEFRLKRTNLVVQKISTRKQEIPVDYSSTKTSLGYQLLRLFEKILTRKQEIRVDYSCTKTPLGCQLLKLFDRIKHSMHHDQINRTKSNTACLDDHQGSFLHQNIINDIRTNHKAQKDKHKTK